MEANGCVCVICVRSRAVFDRHGLRLVVMAVTFGLSSSAGYLVQLVCNCRINYKIWGCSLLANGGYAVIQLG